MVDLHLLYSTMFEEVFSGRQETPVRVQMAWVVFPHKLDSMLVTIYGLLQFQDLGLMTLSISMKEQMYYAMVCLYSRSMVCLFHLLVVLQVTLLNQVCTCCICVVVTPFVSSSYRTHACTNYFNS